MPKPWPRPYECVRRAWHSERHQPMRGSIIKEIFRIAHETHSPTTKKNKEWQEKLPIVVLKAEEIMYSKANSEAEYMDPMTVWERVNDAIDTIIRRDESDESGEFLQPCIEAALGLGCFPRKASRSQRNANPRFYLGSYRLGRGDGDHKPSAPPASPASQCSNLLNPAITLNSKIVGMDPPQNCDFHMLNGDINISPVPASLGSGSYSAYPLCYGTYAPPKPQPGFVALPTTAPKPSFVNDEKILEASTRHKEPFTTITEEDQPEMLVCDLSLRLAPLSVSVPRESEHDVRQSSSLMESEAYKELPVHTWTNSVPTLVMSSVKMMESRDGHPNMNPETRKRRAVDMVDDQQQGSWQPKLLCAYSAGSARIAGL